MGLELIIFIISMLFGVLLYWRESNSNNAYRIFNKLINSKALQLKAKDKTGFVFNQKLILRVVYITFMYITILLVLQFLIPIGYTTVSIFVSSIVGTVAGTYLANVMITSSKIVEDKSDSLSDLVTTTIQKGKSIINDIAHKEANDANNIESFNSETTKPKPTKSARTRLKDKGLM